MPRTSVAKTYKLYIGGKFVRSESGQSFSLKNPKVNIAKASRKDLKESMVAARAAFPDWSKKTAFNRGQILYRLAEMLEGRSSEFVQLISETSGASKAQAEKEVAASVDRLVWYAGWADKYPQVFGSVNPVALPYFNFSSPEPMGVVGIVVNDDFSLLTLVSQLAPVIVSGNTAICLISEKSSLTSLVFAEVCHSSDIPGGVINILSGSVDELIPHLAKHMDLNAIEYSKNNPKNLKLLQEEAAANMKRIVYDYSFNKEEWFSEKAASPYWINSFTETKTTWHPVGI